MRGRTAILKHYMNGVEFHMDVDPSIIARGCPGYVVVVIHLQHNMLTM